MYILGISAFYHDSAASIIRSGEIIAAVQEERFTRIKHDESFPIHSIRYCLQAAGIKPDQITNIVFYEKPFLKFERILETYLSVAPKGFKSFAKSIPLWVKDKIFLKSKIINNLIKIDDNINWKSKLLFSQHHLSHAASAFFPSPFQEAAILTLDGVGEWSTTSLSVGKNNQITTFKEINFPHSLGLLYSAFTYYTGFKVNSGEYKLMGLAPYGEPIYVNKIKDNIVQIFDDGSYKLNMKFFDFLTDLKMTNQNFENLFGNNRRLPETKLSKFHMDIAASIQKVTEEIILKTARYLKKETSNENLCMSGGVALNCVANGKLLSKDYFKNIWIQPASGDAGGSLGAALAVWHMHYKEQRQVNKNDTMQGSYLGPKFESETVSNVLQALKANFTEMKTSKLIDAVVDDLVAQKAVGWMQGRMEFGPRALGARSILGDPRSDKMQKNLNLKVKYRESFRPFAPSILREDLSEWFDLSIDSPYMLFVANLNSNKKIEMSEEQDKLFGIDKLNIKRSNIPAVTHVDYSARIQTVSKENNKHFYDLIYSFKERTGCPLIINTSFNVRGEPIVSTPTDAFNCFMGTELDYLVIGNCILDKKKQNPNLKKDYSKSFELD